MGPGWLILLTMLVTAAGGEESHGKSLDSFDLRVMHPLIKDGVAHLIIIFSHCCRYFYHFVCLGFFFFFRSQFKNRNCHDWIVFLLVWEDNICKHYKRATEKMIHGMCVCV